MFRFYGGAATHEPSRFLRRDSALKGVARSALLRLAAVLSFMLVASSAAAALCPAGTYGTGTPDCTVSPAGTYAPLGSTSPITDPAGTYSPAGSSSPTVAPAGTYAPAGSASPIPVPPGFYSPTIGAASSSTGTPCPLGTFSYGGAAACRAGTYAGFGTASPKLTESLANNGVFAPVLEGSSESTTLSLGNTATGFGGIFGTHITDLTILSISVVGNAAFSIDWVPQTLYLSNGSQTKLTIDFDPTSFGPYSATLRIVTDEHASYGATGDTFNFSLSGQGLESSAPAPEPCAWVLMIGGFGLAGAALRRRRAIVAA